MWKISLRDDPLPISHNTDRNLYATKIVSATCRVQEVFQIMNSEAASSPSSSWEAFQEGGRAARVALADFLARSFRPTTTSSDQATENAPFHCQWALLCNPTATTQTTSTSSRVRNSNAKSQVVPYMFERTDIWCSTSDDCFHAQLRVLIFRKHVTEGQMDSSLDGDACSAWTDLIAKSLEQRLGDILQNPETLSELMNHVAIAVLQEKLRAQLTDMNAIAFVANEAILPRKSGASSAPMSSPPAIPFQAPPDSPMSCTVEVPMGKLRAYLKHLPATPPLRNGHRPDSDTVTLAGLMVPKGVSLIVGGGYHGKSTLLRTIAAGVYNKLPGDGREFCVTATGAVSVRAEDGRYVNNCNVSAFIANLPTLPGLAKAVDTSHFSTDEASGSTSQAANVVEAIEMGCSAMLVDEDVSAANFMARDGRMRALVMDESITPLLYRVNGLYQKYGVSSVVVVGGVGDWLDVPDAVILLDKYLCRDATKKARSVSRQFSHGHVQYAGRGVVHRLLWDKTGTPIPRRPTDDFSSQFTSKNTGIALLEGANTFTLYKTEDNSMVDDDDEYQHLVDMARCEQLLGKKGQLYGCGLCLLWVLEAARRFPGVGLPGLLKKLDEALDEKGFAALLWDEQGNATPSMDTLLGTIGCAYRPRRFEVGQALTRLRGVKLEETTLEEDDEDAAAAAEEERKKQELMALWNSRRSAKVNDN